MTSDVARVRVSIVGVVVLALLGALLGRLWVLQVATSPEAAERIVVANTTKVIQSESTRGRIFDRKGRLLIGNQAEWAIYVDPDIRQDDERKALIIRRLARVLRTTPAALDAAEIAERIDDPQQDPAEDLLVAHGPEEVTDEVRLQILEHQEAYPLVKIAMRSTRVYPFVFTDRINGETVPLAAHVLGYVGNVNAEDLENLEGYESSDTIGRAGIESAFEAQLRGRPQKELVLLDPSRSRIGEPEVLTEGKPGNDVYLTIDLDVQAAAEISLNEAIRQARQFQDPNADVDADPTNDDKTFAAPGGAVAVLDVRSGDVVALASYPSYPVQEFVGGIPAELYDRLQDDPASPRTNRATAGQYAIGSTFKPFVALAAMKDGLRSISHTINDTRGYIEIGEGDNYRRFHNAGRDPSGVVDMRSSLSVSSDVFYYEIGFDYYNIWNNGGDDPKNQAGNGIQNEARVFGFGSKLDIPLGEAPGRVPDQKWKSEFAELIYEDPVTRNENDDWNPGDNINLSVGQGDFLATPLQLANAYGALANGGDLYAPQFVDKITDVDGAVTDEGDVKRLRRIELDPAQRQMVVDGLRDVVNNENGTAFDVFTNTPASLIDVAGKTGTAQVANKGDTSWFAAFYPAAAPEYVVVAVVEEAGRGARVAAPIVRSVIEQLAFGKVTTPMVVVPEADEQAD